MRYGIWELAFATSVKVPDCCVGCFGSLADCVTDFD